MRTSNQVSMPLLRNWNENGVDHHHRSHGEGDEQGRDASGESGSGLALPHLSQEAVEVVSDEKSEREQSRNVDEQEHRVQAVESCRALRRVAHQPQRGEQQDERGDGQDSGVESAHCVSTQEYQSSRTRHRDPSQASGRNGDGRASMSSRARSRTR